ncbi:MAG: amino acid permease [Candidatus Obscuribacterales bacterium]|nr:amino acid permease [Candidatus Obscuribacterales bacterium]
MAAESNVVKDSVSPQRRTYGTFEGVFTPTLLAILGVIMYLRLGWVVGNAGILGALLIIALAVLITATTGLSLSSIATNTRMEAGGPFAIMYRSLGREVAGSLGMPLFFSQSLAVALYIFGFREGWLWIFPGHLPMLVDFATFAIVFGIAYVSAGFAFRIQYFILAVIGLSLLSIFASPVKHFPVAEAEQLWGQFSDASFWEIFAVFFPATTGIMVGANMSGELTNPRRSIPLGTLGAIVISTVIYVLLALWCGHAALPSELRMDYMILIERSFWGPIVLAGLLGATFSSALSSYVGAPRILQAMGAKHLLPNAQWFAAVAPNGEPRHAMLATSAIVAIGLLLRDLNAIAALITMFFLITYCALNVIVLLESSLGLLSFRPSLLIPRIIPFAGAVGCIFAMFIINPVFSLIACALVFSIYVYLVGHNVGKQDNDTRSSFFEAIAAWTFVRLSVFDRDNPRTWKPNLLVPVEDPDELAGEYQFLLDLGRPEGSLKLLGLATAGTAEDLSPRISILGSSFRENKLFTTWSTIDCVDYFKGVVTGLQALQSAFFRPNVLVLRVPDVIERHAECLKIIAEARRVGVGVLLLAEHEKSGYGRRQVVNLWVRPELEENLADALHRGAMHLAILFSIQVTRAWNGRLNLISAVPDAAMEDDAKVYLEKIIEVCRLPASASCHILTGNLYECTAKAPQSDLDVMGLQTTPDMDFIAKMVDGTKSSHVFVLDSGKEDALA